MTNEESDAGELTDASVPLGTLADNARNELRDALGNF